MTILYRSEVSAAMVRRLPRITFQNTKRYEPDASSADKASPLIHCGCFIWRALDTCMMDTFEPLEHPQNALSEDGVEGYCIESHISRCLQHQYL